MMRQVMVFQIGEEYYGLDITRVRDIVEFGSLTPVPKAPNWVKGILNHYGRVITVMSLSSFFDLPSQDRNALRIAVLDNPLVEVGVLVEGHIEITSEWEPTSKIPGESEFAKSRYVGDVIVSRGRVVSVIDMGRLAGDLDGYFT